MGKYRLEVARDRFGWVWVLRDKRGWSKDAGVTNTRWGAIRAAKKALKYADNKPEVIKLRDK